ncbi:hypothetical protein LNP05_23515 [Klebsiella pneumoniae subsp. pneumoniae]|nr:hypothetical protein [Klebsiella pneumoniae subsp. pneumoniae]
MHVQSARGRQRQQLGGELLRAQPAAGRIGDAAAAGIDAGQPGNCSAVTAQVMSGVNSAPASGRFYARFSHPSRAG